ncbi:MAG: HAD family hydrolase [Actinomycetes bacterium]
MPDRPFDTVILDFYGTLGHATHWLGIDAVLSEHGYEFPDDVRRRWWFESEHDGMTHEEHSADEDAYLAWQRDRLMGMLAECDVHPGEVELIYDTLRAGKATRVLEPYAESAPVLAELRAREFQLVVCSNWDWDLVEAIDEVGLTGATDLLVSSAWAGARKPHPLIFQRTLDRAGADPARTLFVGDTWGPDVVGPRAAGMTPLYLMRSDHWEDPTAPTDPSAEAWIAADLTRILDLV